MEFYLTRKLAEEVHDMSCGVVSVGAMVTDDDSTLWKHCRSVENGGRLKTGIYKPKFLADPSHRAEVMIKPIFSMVGVTKKPGWGENGGCPPPSKVNNLLRHEASNRWFRYLFQNVRARVEHLFENYSSCHPSWCWLIEIFDNLRKNIKNSGNDKVSTSKMV